MDPLRIVDETASYNDEELEKLTKELQAYAIAGLTGMRELNPRRIPKELEPTEMFYKDIISATSVFLANK